MSAKPYILTERLVALYATGLSTAAIGHRVGMSGVCVRRRLKRAGLQLRPAAHLQAFDAATKRRAVDAYLANDGAEATEIAARFGTTDRSLFRWVREAGHSHPRMPGCNLTPAQRREVILAYVAAAGASLRTIGRRHNVDARTLGQWVRAAGYQTRSQPRRERHPWNFKVRRSRFTTAARSTTSERVDA